LKKHSVSAFSDSPSKYHDPAHHPSQHIIPPKPDFLHNFWLTKADNLFPYLAVAVGKLLSAHATPFADERNWSAWGCIYTTLCNSLGLEVAEKKCL